MFKQNDILVDKQGNERKVLGVCGEIVFYRDTLMDDWISNGILVDSGWTLKQEKWKPLAGVEYWFVDDHGDTFFLYWAGNKQDQFRLSTGNCHKSESDALAYKDRLIAWANENK